MGTLHKCHTTKPPSLDSLPLPPLPEPPSTTTHHLLPPPSLPERTTNSWLTSLNSENPTEPSLNSTSERNNSLPDTTRSRASTLMSTTPTLLDTTNSPTRPTPKKKMNGFMQSEQKNVV